MTRISTKKKREQLEVPGTERKRIPEVEAAAEKLRECRVERMSLQAEEVDLQANLLDEMTKHGVTTYRFQLDEDELVATAESKQKVKIRKVSVPSLRIVGEDA